MAAGRASKGGRRPPKSSRPAKPQRSTTSKAAPGAKKRTRPAPPPPAAVPALPVGPFRLGAVPGTTPGKWIDIWQERMPDTALELVAVSVAEQREAVASRAVDAALVRLPVDREGLHVIALYDELPVVVCAADSHLTAVEELGLDDLAGEVVIVPGDDVLHVDVPGAEAPRFAPPETTADAIATVAAGVGVVIVPMSLARLHQRKDVEYRPLRDAPTSTVALAWPSADPSPLVDTFVGIVRGRTANSSRG
ncbi:LysR substrate-binding domain-containing protein [Microbacterium sp. LjRoot45]|uniref:LysR substrate-binding domain-containing protein n=1 Tax=Microbacterium sp. LjRoot45 TaxID=3342329 RepID=UPI003ECF7F4F